MYFLLFHVGTTVSNTKHQTLNKLHLCTSSSTNYTLHFTAATNLPA